jgi:hypothetical protein
MPSSAVSTSAASASPGLGMRVRRRASSRSRTCSGTAGTGTIVTTSRGADNYSYVIVAKQGCHTNMSRCDTAIVDLQLVDLGIYNNQDTQPQPEQHSTLLTRSPSAGEGTTPAVTRVPSSLSSSPKVREGEA